MRETESSCESAEIELKSELKSDRKVLFILLLFSDIVAFFFCIKGQVSADAAEVAQAALSSMWIWCRNTDRVQIISAVYAELQKVEHETFY